MVYVQCIYTVVYLSLYRRVFFLLDDLSGNLKSCFLISKRTHTYCCLVVISTIFLGVPTFHFYFQSFDFLFSFTLSEHFLMTNVKEILDFKTCLANWFF